MCIIGLLHRRPKTKIMTAQVARTMLFRATCAVNAHLGSHHRWPNLCVRNRVRGVADATGEVAGHTIGAMPRIATADRVSRDELLGFVSSRHRYVLMTSRADGRPQMSPVTGGVDDAGRIVISTYPDRAKAVNLRRNPMVSVLVLSDDWDDAWVQVDGECEVLDATDGDEALDAFVEYFRNIAGEHSDWDEYRTAMVEQGKSLLRITPTRWGTVSTGGFPPEVAERS
jgi:PPOX class probable F420-dependent enzyme